MKKSYAVRPYRKTTLSQKQNTGLATYIRSFEPLPLEEAEPKFIDKSYSFPINGHGAIVHVRIVGKTTVLEAFDSMREYFTAWIGYFARKQSGKAKVAS